MPFVYLFILTALFLPGRLLAEIPGTALANERDLARFDLMGGVTFPATGLTLGGAALWTFRRAHAVGLATHSSFMGSDSEGSAALSQPIDLIWEHSTALMEGFHALRVRVGVGASSVQRSIKVNMDPTRNKLSRRQTWAGHALASVALDIPVADLAWVRLGLMTEKSFLEKLSTQNSLFAGWVFGGQWLGIGD